ncbi:Ig-like domain-containing protein, partial [Gemmatimonas sp.]|uniref:Ig-like domain-containing protein n=1 Tax=Gemmatimonas sp. TaxID=1962908 RepID=UPI00286AAED3
MQRILLSASVVIITACGHDIPVAPADNLTTGEAVKVDPISASAVSDGVTEIKLGQTTTLQTSAAFRRSRTTRWSSSNSNVVSVNSSGAITGRSLGTATVTALGGDGSREQFSTRVVPSTVVATVDISGVPFSLSVGGTVALVATARDADGAAIAGRVATWSLAGGSSVTVSASGVVTAVSNGS